MNFYVRAEWKEGRWRAWLRTPFGEFEVTRWLPILRRFLRKSDGAPIESGSAVSDDPRGVGAP